MPILDVYKHTTWNHVPVDACQLPPSELQVSHSKTHCNESIAFCRVDVTPLTEKKQKMQQAVVRCELDT